MAHEGGRPTKLTPELIVEGQKYVTELDLSIDTLLPTIEGLARRLYITRETLYQWEKDNKQFSDILENIRQLQADKLIQNGVLGRYNPAISKMMLSKYGYVEKTEQDINHSGEVQFINDVPRPKNN